jgi:acyl-coenzyme A synthetase/AMP-(fatty) acid ligase
MTASCELTTAITALLAPNRDHEFLTAGTTIGEVYAMAAWLRANLPAGKNAAPVCLAADDRAVIAAALLASLAGGPVLLMPYAFSAQALAGLQKTTGATIAISDTTRDLPSGMEIITPRRGDSGPPLDTFNSNPGKELLRLYTGGSTGMPQIWSKTGINIFG